MAVAILSSDYSAGTVRGKAYAAVMVKPTWAADWQYVPYLEAVRASEEAAPSVGSAELRWVYGDKKQWDSASFGVYGPANLHGWYCAIWGHDANGSAALWYGVIVVNRAKIGGDASVASGRERMTAFELGYLLERVEVNGSYTEAGYIDRPLKFNGRHGFGLAPQGNRGALDVETNTYEFGEGDDRWSNAQIAAYLLERFGPDGVTFQLVGQLDALDAIVDEHDFEGWSVWDALNRLIDRRRGLGFRIVSDGAGVIYVWVFSVLADPVAFGDAVLPANPYQVWLDFTGSYEATAEVGVSLLDRYHTVIVRGGPVRSCFTCSYADGTLVKGWEEADETAYLESTGSTTSGIENDLERATDKYLPVFQIHRLNIPDWLVGPSGDDIAAPKALDDGRVSLTTSADVHWNHQRVLRRNLPLEVDDAVDGAAVEYRPAFGVCTYNSQIAYLDALAEDEGPSVSFRVHDRELAVVTDARPNHRLALNHWTGAKASVAVPKVDYETLYVTVMADTDERLKVVRRIAGYGQGDILGTKVINASRFESWFIADNTVTDVTNDASELGFYDGGAFDHV